MQFIKYLLAIVRRLFSPRYVKPLEELREELPEVDLSTIKGGTKPSKYFWILDNGHGKYTSGKRSPKLPDGRRLLEYQYNRKIVRGICAELERLGIDHINLVPIDNVDNWLKGRVDKANSIQTDKKRIYISVHGNAGPTAVKGKWGNSRGVETWYFHGSKRSESIAEVFQKHLVAKTGLIDRKTKTRATKQFYVLRNTEMPSILTENGFFNNIDECLLMLSDKFVKKVVDAHIEAILEIERDF